MKRNEIYLTKLQWNAFTIGQPDGSIVGSQMREKVLPKNVKPVESLFFIAKQFVATSSKVDQKVPHFSPTLLHLKRSDYSCFQRVL